MIFKGAARNNAVQAVYYLLDMERSPDEKSRLVDIVGGISNDPREVAKEWEAIARGTRCVKNIYHLSLNHRKGEDLTPEQNAHAIDKIAEKLGLANCSRIVVEHEKDGRTHQHILFNRIDPDTGKAVKMSHNYRNHEETARELEAEFSLQHTQGRHALEKGEMPADRGPTHDEMQTAKKTGVNLYKWRQEVRDILQAELAANPNATGRDIAAALESGAHILAHGDKRQNLLMILDPAGTPHALSRSLKLRVKDGEFAALFGDIKPENLPSIEEAQRLQAQRQAERAAEIERRRASHRGATLYENGSMAAQQKDALKHHNDITAGRNTPRTATEILKDKSRAIGKEGEQARGAKDAMRDMFNRDFGAAPAKGSQGRSIETRERQAEQTAKPKTQQEERRDEKNNKTEQTADQIRAQQREAMKEMFERNFGRVNTANLNELEQARGRHRER